jgi:hypothetical protein
MASKIQPLALIDKCIGSRIWVIMKVITMIYHTHHLVCCYLLFFCVLIFLIILEWEGNCWHPAWIRRLREHGTRRCRGDRADWRWPQGGECRIEMIFVSSTDAMLLCMWSLCASLQTKVDQMLLNGANICLMVPGGDPLAWSDGFMFRLYIFKGLAMMLFAHICSVAKLFPFQRYIPDAIWASDNNSWVYRAQHTVEIAIWSPYTFKPNGLPSTER